MKTIDLNCDMGESYGAWKMGADADVMPHITSANIACGFHGGDPATIRETVRLAVDNGVAIGGTATRGSDYDGVPTFINLQANQTTALIDVVPRTTAVLSNGAEFVRVSIQPDSTYRVGNPSSARVVIVDEQLTFSAWRSRYFAESTADLLVFANQDFMLHNMIVTTIWGTPGFDQQDRLPRVPVVTVNKQDGDRLKALLARGRGIKVRIVAEVKTGWFRSKLPEARIPGTEEPETFILAGGHSCAWEVGTTDNATGNASLIELAISVLVSAVIVMLAPVNSPAGSVRTDVRWVPAAKVIFRCSSTFGSITTGTCTSEGSGGMAPSSNSGKSRAISASSASFACGSSSASRTRSRSTRHDAGMIASAWPVSMSSTTDLTTSSASTPRTWASPSALVVGGWGSTSKRIP